jgi:very-short-patch-repair endonuclease
MPHQEIPPNNRRFGKAMRQAMTRAEFRLWTRLRNRQFGDLRFRRQAPLGAYIVDFLCLERRLLVEVDGDQHGFPKHETADAKRDEWLRKEGFVVLRFTNRDAMSDSTGVCETILSAARAHVVADGGYPSPKPASPVSALPQGEG